MQDPDPDRRRGTRAVRSASVYVPPWNRRRTGHRASRGTARSSTRPTSKGFTKLHPEGPEELAGPYAGLAQQPVIDHLVDLGVTSIELLPVQHFVPNRCCSGAGSRTIGLQPVGYFAPHTPPTRRMVSAGSRSRSSGTWSTRCTRPGSRSSSTWSTNHTAEGDHRSDALAWKGSANAGHVLDARRGMYDNPTGCGNAIRAESPHGRVDPPVLRATGSPSCTRTDSASTLRPRWPARRRWSPRGPRSCRRWLRTRCSQVKLIAEPWDIGIGGHQAGNFPSHGPNGNDVSAGRSSDTWRSIGSLSELGASDQARPTGSPQRPPAVPPINFITAHDGFTLADLVSYNDKTQ